MYLRDSMDNSAGPRRALRGRSARATQGAPRRPVPRASQPPKSARQTQKRLSEYAKTGAARADFGPRPWPDTAEANPIARAGRARLR
jgi:hypothetical protein